VYQVNDPTGGYTIAYDNIGRQIGTATQYSFLPGKTYTAITAFHKEAAAWAALPGM
jgi:hypothetical protein